MPEGLKTLENIWVAFMPDYNIHGGFIKTGICYIISATIGSSIIVALVCLAGRFLKK